RNAPDVPEAGPNARAQLVDRLLRVGMRRRRASGEVRRGVLRRVARRLDLADELVLVRGEARLREDVGLEALRLRVRDPDLEPAVEVLEHLPELGDRRGGLHGART